MSQNDRMTAIIDFDCVDCARTVQFDLMTLKEQQGQAQCEHCHRLYQFDRPFLGKLEKLRNLVLAVRDAQDILGDCDVAIQTAVDEVRVPYRLLLTRLNTIVSLRLGDRVVDFNFRVEPFNEAAFK